MAFLMDGGDRICNVEGGSYKVLPGEGAAKFSYPVCRIVISMTLLEDLCVDKGHGITCEACPLPVKKNNIYGPRNRPVSYDRPCRVLGSVLDHGSDLFNEFAGYGFV